MPTRACRTPGLPHAGRPHAGHTTRGHAIRTACPASDPQPNLAPNESLIKQCFASTNENDGKLPNKANIVLIPYLSALATALATSTLVLLMLVLAVGWTRLVRSMTMVWLALSMTNDVPVYPVWPTACLEARRPMYQA